MLIRLAVQLPQNKISRRGWARPAIGNTLLPIYARVAGKEWLGPSDFTLITEVGADSKQRLVAVLSVR